MKWRARSAITWLLALAMPFQVMTAVYLDVRGPAHFHVESAHGGHRHDRGPETASGRSPDYGHYLPHFHGALHVERHHHHPHDSSVVTVQAPSLLESVVLTEETTSGWSGIMLVALLAGGGLLLVARMLRSLATRPEPSLYSRPLGRLERPPRIAPL